MLTPLANRSLATCNMRIIDHGSECHILDFRQQLTTRAMSRAGANSMRNGGGWDEITLAGTPDSFPKVQRSRSLVGGYIVVWLALPFAPLSLSFDLCAAHCLCCRIPHARLGHHHTTAEASLLSIRLDPHILTTVTRLHRHRNTFV